MPYVTGVILYIVIWWITIFMVLPWGARPPKTIQAGHATSAPEKPHLGKKLLINSLLAAILWGVAYVVIQKGLINLDDWSLVDIK